MTTHILSTRTLRAWDSIDAMPGDLRACVHEFGLPIVQVLLKFGIRNPAHIREIVREVWQGARSPQQRSRIPEGLMTVDWLLSQQSCDLNVKLLWRLLYQGQYAIVPLTPNRLMLDASMREVSGFNERVTKEEKHRRRYMAAVKAFANQVNHEIAEAA